MKSLYNSNNGRVARPLRPRKRKTGDMPSWLADELAQLSTMEKISISFRANVRHIKF
jgi:hypothetical protein